MNVGVIRVKMREKTGSATDHLAALVAQVSNLLYRRFPNRQGVETFGASAGLETCDTADWEVCATICV
jgi:hypothetical protein